MFEYVDPKKDKIIYPFKKSDGCYRPCKKGCPNCLHCTDVYWDYSNGIYLCLCNIHECNNGLCDDYENDGTQPLTIAEWNGLKRKEDGDWR